MTWQSVVSAAGQPAIITLAGSPNISHNIKCVYASSSTAQGQNVSTLTMANNNVNFFNIDFAGGNCITMQEQIVDSDPLPTTVITLLSTNAAAINKLTVLYVTYSA